MRNEFSGVKSRSVIACLSIFVFCVSCSEGGGGSSPLPPQPPVSPGPPQPPPAPPADPNPDALSVGELTGAQVPGLHNMKAFLPSADASDAAAAFNGTLTISETAFASDATPVLEPTIHPGFEILRLPRIIVDLVSDNGDLIPIQRNRLSNWPQGGSYWDAIVGPGKVWREPVDAIWDRASFPLTLVSRKEGQARNCVVAFLFNSVETSKAFVQCSQENSPASVYGAGDMRTLADANVKRDTISDSAGEIATFRTERLDRYPVKDWSEVPVGDPQALQTVFNEGAPPASAQSFGALIVDGVMYRQPPLTRHGPYPYPDDMRHGVHSMTKTLSGGLSMLYLAQRYGESVFDALITDYIPEASAAPGWTGVTFEHVLNMVTGTAGEDAGAASFIFRPDSAWETLEFIAALGDAPPAPGTTFSYATTHTFVLSFAMQRFVEAQEGPGAYYWDMVQRDVLDPIGVFDFPIQTSLEPGGARGVPTLGVGAFPTADDIAKIVQLYRDAGNHDGRQLLHRGRTLEATNNSVWPGYAVTSRTSYQHSFWLYSVTSTARACSFKASTMQGFGGNFAILLPSGIAAIRLADNEQYDFAPMIRAAEEIRSSC